jgi:O-antigen/teichoic acid export membrane protein
MAPKLAASCLIACALLPLSALSELTAGLLRGLQRVIQSQAPPQIVRPILFGLGLLLCVYIARVHVGAPTAIALNATAVAIALLVSWRFLHRDLPAEIENVAEQYATREWWRVALGLLLIDAAQVVLSQQSDVVVVGSLIGTTASGHYGAASQLAALVQFGVTSIMFIATPMIAELYAQGRRADLQRLVTTVGLLNMMFTLPVLAGLVLGGRFILGWYGRSFPDVFPVLVVLATSQSIVAMLGTTAGYLVSMTGHQDAAAMIIGASAVLNLGLTFLLTSAFGMIGTASATLIATLTRSVALTIYIRKQLHINPLPFSSRALRSEGPQSRR